MAFNADSEQIKFPGFSLFDAERLDSDSCQLTAAFAALASLQTPRYSCIAPFFDSHPTQLIGACGTTRTTHRVLTIAERA